MHPHGPAAREPDALYILFQQASLPGTATLQPGCLLIRLGGTSSGETMQAQHTVTSCHPTRSRSIPHLPLPAAGEYASFGHSPDLSLAGSVTS